MVSCGNLSCASWPALVSIAPLANIYVEACRTAKIVLLCFQLVRLVFKHEEST